MKMLENVHLENVKKVYRRPKRFKSFDFILSDIITGIILCTFVPEYRI